MIKNYYKETICTLLLIFFIGVQAKTNIDTHYVQSHKNKFEQYLKDLKFSMSVPTCLIKKSMNII